MGCGIFAMGCCILEIAPQDVLALFVIGRLVAGLGVGFISTILILYMVGASFASLGVLCIPTQSEIAPKKVRGALVSAYQFCITIGILIANCVVFGTQASGKASNGNKAGLD
jgi:MFS family permease